jgi:DNA-binding transcriptional MerR regulator
MTQPANFQPAQVAGLLAVDPATVRRWSEWHAEHLSAGANPAPGKRRVYTAHDVAVFQAVQALRLQGLATPAVNARLHETTIAEIVPPTAQDGPGTTIAPLAAQIDPTALQNALQPVAEAQASQGARIERIENQLQSSLYIFLVGVAVGGVVVALLAILVAVVARGG